MTNSNTKPTVVVTTAEGGCLRGDCPGEICQGEMSGSWNTYSSKHILYIMSLNNYDDIEQLSDDIAYLCKTLYVVETI